MEWVVLGVTNNTKTKGVVALTVLVATVMLLAAPAAADSMTRHEDPDLVPNVEGENTVESGETVTLQVAVQNRGSYIGEARASSDHLSGLESIDTPGTAIGTLAEFTEGEAPIEVRSGRQTVGSVTPRRPTSVPLTVEIDDDADPGVYEIPVEFDYEYVRIAISDDLGAGGNQGSFQVLRDEETETETVEVRVERTVDLEILSLRGEGLRAGDDGVVSATVRNDGHETAHEASLNFVGSEQFTAQAGSKYVGDIKPGQTASARFRVSVSDSYTGGDGPVNLSLEYEDGNGVSGETEPETGGVTVEGDADFGVSAEAEAMYVDSVGAVHATVTNTGDTAVNDARFVLRENAPFQPVSDRASLGDLEPGESARVSFRVEVSDRALAQSYPIEGYVEYQDSFDETRRSDTATDSVGIGPERGFSVEGTPAVTAGSTRTVEFTVENTGGGVMRDAVARINVDSPFSTDDDTTYVGDLAPGESEEVSYRVSTESGATPKAYSVDTVVKYDNAFGDKVVTEINKAPVEVEEKKGIVATLLGLL